MTTHNYKTTITWTGNTGTGTSGYRDYKRDHLISVEGKEVINASSDKSFRGDENLHNPEDLFVASLSSCHMLWYLHLCAVAGIAVQEYEDEAHGSMITQSDGSGQFSEVVLNPVVVIDSSEKLELARELHHKANEMCFIANSCNFEVKHRAVIKTLQ